MKKTAKRTRKPVSAAMTVKKLKQASGGKFRADRSYVSGNFRTTINLLDTPQQ